MFLSAPGRRKYRFFTRSSICMLLSGRLSPNYSHGLASWARAWLFLTDKLVCRSGSWAVHRTRAHCRRGVTLSQQLSSEGTCAPNSTSPAMGAHTPRSPVSWVSNSILGHQITLMLMRDLALTLVPALSRSLWPQGSYSDFSSKTWIFILLSHVPCKFKIKKKKISPANIFFLQSFPAVLAPVLVLPM